MVSAPPTPTLAGAAFSPCRRAPPRGSGGGGAVLVGAGAGRRWAGSAAAGEPEPGWGAAGAVGRAGAPVLQAGAAAAGVASSSQGCRGGWCGWCGCPGARASRRFPAGLLKLQRGACGERRPLRPSAADGTQGLCSTARPRAGKAHHHGRSCWHALAEVDACTSWHHQAGGILRAGSLVRSGREGASRCLGQSRPPRFLVLTLLCLCLSLLGAALVRAGPL